MNCSIVRISLDVHKTYSGAVVYAKRGDVGRRIQISLTDGGAPYRIGEDCLAVFTSEKPDGKVLYNKCDIQGNLIVYDMTEQTTAVAGRMECEIKLYGADGKLITSPCFLLIVDDAVYDEGDEVESSDEFSALTDALAKVAQLGGVNKTYFVDVFPAGDGYVTDEDINDILQACNSNFEVVCLLEANWEQAHLQLPLVKYDATAAYFGAVLDGEEYLLTITADADGNTVSTVTQRAVGSGGTGEGGALCAPEVYIVGSGEPTGSEVIWIDPNANPDAGFVPIPATASVGQTIVVKEVDENGKPTKWGTAEMPSSGGEKWRLINTVELTEDATSIDITEDSDGNSFALKKIIIQGELAHHSADSSAYSAYVNIQDDKGTKSGPCYTTNAVISSVNKRCVFGAEILPTGRICGYGWTAVDHGSEALMYWRHDAGKKAMYSFKNGITNISIRVGGGGSGFGSGTYVELWGSVEE